MKLTIWIERALDWLARVITQPRHELTRWQVAVRFAYDLGRYGAMQLQRDRAPQMAGALAFRTLFGLIPVTIMSALLVRTMRGPEAFDTLIRRVSEALGLFEVQGAGDTSLGSLVGDLVKEAYSVNLSTIGWVGLAVLIYSAISLMVTIENSFNIIFRAPEGRSWMKCVPMYWFVLTVGPVLIGATFFLNSRVAGWIESVEAWQWLLTFASAFWTFFVTWLFLLVVYLLVPNADVDLRPAMVGGFASAVLLTLGREGLASYLSNAVSINQFNGALGLIPLFMFWVYIMWLVVLFGLEVASTIQALAGRTLEQMKHTVPPTGLVEPSSVIAVVRVIGDRFAEGKSTSPRQIVDQIGIPEATVTVMLDALAEAGILHRLDRESGLVTLSRPADAILAAELVEVGFSLVDEGTGSRRPALLSRLRDAQRTAVAETTLRDLLTA